MPVNQPHPTNSNASRNIFLLLLIFLAGLTIWYVLKKMDIKINMFGALLGFFAAIFYWFAKNFRIS